MPPAVTIPKELTMPFDPGVGVKEVGGTVEQRANRALWLTALRSGKIEQRRGGFAHNGSYCVLGVAYMINGYDRSLAVSMGITPDQYYDLMEANDVRGLSFLELADMIERMPYAA